MKNWYQSTWLKGILIVAAHVFAVIFAVCATGVMRYSEGDYGFDFESMSKTDYVDTREFQTRLTVAGQNILGKIESEKELESDGKYNPDKIVDIKEYADSGKISGENVHGLGYRLEDLRKWSEEYQKYGNNLPNIVVCQRADYTFEYYKIEDFAAKIEKGELQFVSDEDGKYLKDLKENIVVERYYGSESMKIMNEKREIAYIDFWNFQGGITEKIKTADGKTLMEIAGENSEWNGKLTKLYEYLQTTLNGLSGDVLNYWNRKEEWDEGNTNLTYLFADLKHGILYSNRQKYQDIQKIDDYVKELKRSGKYVMAVPKLMDFQTNIETEADAWCSNSKLGTDDYIYMLSVDTKYPIQDSFYVQNKIFEKYTQNKMFVLALLSAIVLLAVILWLTVIAGYTTKSREVKLVWFDKVKTEIAAGGIVTFWILLLRFIAHGTPRYSGGLYASVFDAQRERASYMLVTGIGALVTCACFLVGYLSLVRRIKARTLWENSLLKWLMKETEQFWQYRSCIWKAAAELVVFLLVQWFLIRRVRYYSRYWIVLMIAADAAALYLIVRRAAAREKIKKGIMEISDGNIHYQIPLENLKGDELDMARHINRIGEGLNKAVEQSMKDERLKTDLITNVSHDIKTPLTSIINYVDLLKRENIQDEKIQGYLDVLEVKAQRLKNLTEDVVEASKISSGNITMEYMDIDFVEMIHQTTGEFAEKFAKRNLQVVLNAPDNPVMIHSDGRRMWRVIENIYNNAAKYAMEGTRVYADLVEKEHTVEFTLKNISEQPLNISAEELTERFIRGDLSRSTEGSGLGLSIAKNLTKMQGGEFELYLDGDLFKVSIIFPKVSS